MLILERKIWGEEEMLPKKFINELASKSPAPGGGSASALSGTIGAALVCMVCELTIGKKKYQEVENEMKQVLDNASKLKDEFMALVEKDEDAFNKVMASYKLPKETDEEKQKRSQEIQLTLKGATEVPLEVIRQSKKMVELAVICAEKGNVNSVSDAGVAAIQAQAASQGALYNVLINLGSIKDEEFKAQVKQETDELMREIKTIAEKVEETVKSKL